MKSILFILLIVFSTQSFSQESAYDIFSKSYDKINKATTLRYYNYATEKIKNKYIKDKSLIKVTRNPFKVYIFQEKEGGSEILYNSTINKDKAVVNPGKFPYLNLNLSPYGSIMRNETHHTIFQADIKYTFDVINHTIKNRKSDELLKSIGKVKIDKKILYKLELINRDCKKYRYVIKQGEDINSIAETKQIGAYKILELNPKIPFYDDVEAGDIITIPSYYSKSITIYIDIKTYLPYLIKVYDLKGLYESYKFKDLVLNYQFAKDEFQESFNEYGF